MRAAAAFTNVCFPSVSRPRMPSPAAFNSSSFCRLRRLLSVISLAALTIYVHWLSDAGYQCFRRVVAKHSCKRGIDIYETTVRSALPDTDDVFFKDAAVLFFGSPHALIRPPALGHVHLDGNKMANFPDVRAHWSDGHLLG